MGSRQGGGGDPLKATIQFSDGIIRKIASSHYTILQPADPASFVPIPDSVPVVKVRATPKRQKKTKEPAALSNDIAKGKAYDLCSEEHRKAVGENTKYQCS